MPVPAGCWLDGGPVIKRVKIPAIHISPWEVGCRSQPGAAPEEPAEKNHSGYAVVRTKEHAKKVSQTPKQKPSQDRL